MWRLPECFPTSWPQAWSLLSLCHLPRGPDCGNTQVINVHQCLFGRRLPAFQIAQSNIIDTRTTGSFTVCNCWTCVFAGLVHEELPCRRGPSCQWEAWVTGWSGSTQKTRTLLWQYRMWAILCLEVSHQSFYLTFFGVLFFCVVMYNSSLAILV